MAKSTWFPAFVRALFALSALGVGSGGLLAGRAQALPAKAPAQNSNAVHAVPMIFEDDEIKLRIPAGWKIERSDPSLQWNSPSDESSPLPHLGALLLIKQGYRLSLAYDTGHASGVLGGRFIEAFSIPWLDVDDAWQCSLYLQQVPQPASRELIFLNLTFDTGLPEVREKCGIAKDLGYWSGNQVVGEQRWFGGYFTTEGGGWFFDSQGKICGVKTYTLTKLAKTPEELPDMNDPELKRIIEESIDLVDAIRYKRCPPAAPHSPVATPAAPPS